MSLAGAIEIRKGKRLVLTNGVFDILHAGHVDSLRRARSLGDLLFVGLNSDASARKLGKGPGRPINGEADRAAVLEAIRYVDGVILFDEETPIEILRSLRPEVYAKGGDYSLDRLPEAEFVKGYGGEVALLPLLPGRSTTEIERRCRS